MWILTDMTGQMHISEGGGLSKVEESQPMLFLSEISAQNYQGRIRVRTPLIPVEQKTVDLLKMLQQERKSLRDAGLYPKKDIEHLTYSALAIASITEGRACKILGLDRIQVRDGFSKWLQDQPQYVRDAEAFVLNHGGDRDA